MSAPTLRSHRLTAVLALSVVLGSALGGCELRLATPAATEPTASAAELLRSREVSDALTLEQAARTARSTAAGAAAPVAPVLDDVVAFSTRHAAELGGVYSSGLHPSSSPTVSAATAPPSTPADVLAVLASTAAEALGTADSGHDGGMARLLAAIGTSRAQLASRLATALGLPAPTITPRAATAVQPSSSPSGTPSSPAPSGAPTTAGATGPTSGLSPADLDALTVVEDQAGYGLEVVAAKLEGGARARALAAARAHRAAAETWAVRAGTAATARDPRRAAYALPTGLRDGATATALARTLEQAVARTDAAMVAAASPGQRGDLIAGLRAAADAVAAWGGTADPLPGLPVSGPTTAPTPATSASPSA